MSTIYYGPAVGYYSNVRPSPPKRKTVKKSRPSQYGADLLRFGADPQTFAGQALVLADTAGAARLMQDTWIGLVSAVHTLYLYDGWDSEQRRWVTLEDAIPQERPTVVGPIIIRGTSYAQRYRIRMQLNFSQLQ